VAAEANLSSREPSSSVHCDLQLDDKPTPTRGGLDFCVLHEDFGINFLQATTTKGLDQHAELVGEGRAALHCQQGRVQDADANPDGIRAVQPQGMLF
jgi:hypothetical protein